MLILLSPSKTQDVESLAPTELFTEPLFEDERWHLIRKLRELTGDELQKLLKTNDSITAVNIARIDTWKKRHTQKNAKQAIHTFTGAVYKTFDTTFARKQYVYMQQHLRVLSGLYGILRPLDLMQPYRLEMGTKFGFTLKGVTYKNLYEYWGPRISKELLGKKESKVIINLASEEYTKVINTSAWKGRWINVSFYQKKGRKLTQATVYTKQQRGSLAGWMCENMIVEPKGIKKYDRDGYVYSKLRSKKDHFVFVKK